MIEEQNVEPGEASIDVEMFRWARARAPQAIGTFGLGPCIAIAVMNDTSEEAWVLHSPNMRHGQIGLSEMLSDVCDHAKAGHRLRVVVAGGFLDEDAKANKEIKLDREFVLSILEDRLPETPVSIAWEQFSAFHLRHAERSWRDRDGLPCFEPR